MGQNETVEVAYVLDNLMIGDTNVREFFLNSNEELAAVSYAVVREAIQGVLVEREQYWKEQHDQIQAQFELERTQKEAAQENEAKASEANSSLVAQIRDAALKLDDAESKRDAAVRLAEEKDAEIERLNKEVAELKKQLSVAAVAAPKAVDAGESYRLWKEQRQKEEAERPAIYNVRPGDPKTTFYLANLASTGEEIRIPWMTIKSYREVSAEEAPQFRISEESERDNEDLAQPESVEEASDLTPPTWQFPTEEESSGETTGHELAQGDVAGSTAEKAEAEVTRAEFEELKRRVAALEVTKAEVA